jgi:hypothetical protein
MAIKKRSIKVYETSDGKIFRPQDREDAKSHQLSLDIEALKKKLEKQAVNIFLSAPLVREEFEKIDELLYLDRLCEYEEGDEPDLEGFEDTIQSLLSLLISLYKVNPQKMRAITGMIDEHLGALLC